jgi:hypothetical protein
MYRQSKMIGYVIFGLIAIGLLVNLQTMWVPLIIFGVVFYLYKFPPKQFQRGRGSNTYRTSQRPKPNKRKFMFRVIKGNKKDEDDPPKYH